MDKSSIQHAFMSFRMDRKSKKAQALGPALKIKRLKLFAGLFKVDQNHFDHRFEAFEDAFAL